MAKTNTALVVLAVIAGALTLWYLIGSETCEGCFHECTLAGNDRGKCASSCMEKGLKCPIELTALGLAQRAKDANIATIQDDLEQWSDQFPQGSGSDDVTAKPPSGGMAQSREYDDNMPAFADSFLHRD